MVVWMGVGSSEGGMVVWMGRGEGGICCDVSWCPFDECPCGWALVWAYSGMVTYTYVKVVVWKRRIASCVRKKYVI